MILFVVFVVLITMISTDKINKTYHFGSNDIKFNCVASLTAIIEKKLKNKTIIESFISKELFHKLGLINAPVYVLSSKYVGKTHLKLFCSALEKIKTLMNFVLLDAEIKVENEKVNVICLDSKRMTNFEIAILNKLNINDTFSPVKNKVVYDEISNSIKYKDEVYFKSKHNDNIFVSNNEDIISSNYTDKGIIDIGSDAKLIYELPKYCYTYVPKGRRNKVEIYNIFGEKICTVNGKFNSFFDDNYIIINPKPNSELIVVFDNSNLDFLRYDIDYAPFDLQIKKLKSLALSELDRSFHSSCNNIDYTFNDIKDFFKIAFMRKQYIASYKYLIEKIFGIEIKNSLLYSKPIDLITEDFILTYEYKGKKCTLRFTKLDDENVKLNYVGHKLGIIENFVYGF